MRRRVLEAPLGLWLDPESAYLTLHSQDEDSFWLDCGPAATAGVSAMGRASARVSPQSGEPLLHTLRREFAAHGDVEVSAAQGFRLGWVGWIGYDYSAHTLGESFGQGSQHPDAAMLRVDRALVFDHASRTVTLLALGEEWSGELEAWRESTCRTLRAASANPPTVPAQVPHGGPVVWAHDDEQYLRMIAECQHAIRQGDAYQLCLTTTARVEGATDAVAAYLALRRSSPAHHGGLLRIGDTALLSASPEQFLAVDPVERTVETQPIKGTRPRGRTPEADRDLARELRASDKEQAENLMIVDLMRNDLARVCELGTVAVPSLLRVETYPHVHQLVSTVRGRLRAGLSAIDAIAACFPAGSMTGAPKREAVRILTRLEVRPRGIYAGTFGYLGFDGRLDLAMVIRTIVMDKDGATVGAGGGITALSVPDEELAEVKLKAAALLGVLLRRDGQSEDSVSERHRRVLA
ncbi:aminodeoxychorismate synthase component I [Salinibacterium sp. dk2585]|uniref:aminodeoxychorismate synthase component I n=1 Tax=unclassified Salinibacterium TaxID=2632331 RepID=UPI0011C2551B|nr:MULTISPECIES: aminodeoxychorismate synthase component I [unclassified Salinibacterium]QEE61412.1 aminodeoxychorismate synthase component I [Salinibacterium sp. dk2585]TXK54089.1 aminodeoxychorismate synthase component I [Salinibacterium sp. dk5596]